ncbi:methyladenine glycosylase [Lucifera butyrica]|uniref:DNA-3-methyladenine glycosylase I n=1 Tax=Lucifera butyrica TaxID=1351585 RepID=A0A498R9S8_9FIRM|nr:DNA-3-methyladenine glycosylase I [Lucifera butyrica]VBB05898.1 methyladenine glycosylase [Lucifera butyrica]
MPVRCAWAGDDELYIRYHDREWGIPVYDDNRLFEMLILEGMQAGLSWITVLRKRDHFRKVFDGFDALKISQYDEKKIEELVNDPGIIRNRLKIRAAIQNAGCFLEIQQTHGSFSRFIWQFVDGEPRQNAWRSLPEVPAKTAESDRMSRELKKRGFKFVGSTICYAFMQAVGMVNDHVVDCFRYEEIKSGLNQSGRR